MTVVELLDRPVITMLEVSTKIPLYKIGQYSRFAHGIPETQYVSDGMAIMHGDVFSVAEQIYIDIECKVSERLAREINRHRHTAIVQKSTRYNNYSKLDKIEFYAPPELAEFLDLKQSYGATITKMQLARNYSKAYGKAKPVPDELLNYLLPLGTMTEVRYHINLRSLIHMFNVRLCPQALIEFRQFLELVKERIAEISDQWNYIAHFYFNPKCLAGNKFDCKNYEMPCKTKIYSLYDYNKLYEEYEPKNEVQAMLKESHGSMFHVITEKDAKNKQAEKSYIERINSSEVQK